VAAMNLRITSTAALAALLIGSAGGVRAAPMVLDCQVQANQPDHGLTRWRRRIIIDQPTRTVRILDDFGHGFLQRAQYPLVSINPSRIVLENHQGKTSFIDRLTGDYVLRNEARRFMLRGHCVAARPIG
jgi:hypothetical protein